MENQIVTAVEAKVYSKHEQNKNGEIQEGAEVVRDLMRMKKEKALNSSEKNVG